jgi:hypothetical protein
MDGVSERRQVYLDLGNEEGARSGDTGLLSLMLPAQRIRDLGDGTVGIPATEPAVVDLVVRDYRDAARDWTLHISGEILRGGDIGTAQRPLLLRAGNLRGDSEAVAVSNTPDRVVVQAAPMENREVVVELQVRAGALRGKEAQSGIYNAVVEVEIQ